MYVGVVYEPVEYKNLKVGETIYLLENEKSQNLLEVEVTLLAYRNGVPHIYAKVKESGYEILAHHHRFRRRSLVVNPTPLKTLVINNNPTRETSCWSCKREKLSTDINRLHEKSKCTWTKDCIVCPCGAAGCDNPKYKRD